MNPERCRTDFLCLRRRAGVVDENVKPAVFDDRALHQRD